MVIKDMEKNEAESIGGCVSVCVLSGIQLFVTPKTVAPSTPLSMGFLRQEYWSGLPFSLPGGLPNLRIKPESPASPAGRFFTSVPPGKPCI